MTAAIRVPVTSPGDHVAHFYHDDEELAGQAGSYLLEAFRDDGVAIAIATPEHLRALEAWLAGAGIDVPAARARGSWLALDAAATLRRFTSGGTPGAAGFDREVGGLIRQAARGGRAVRAFGEMVGLLKVSVAAGASGPVQVLAGEADVTSVTRLDEVLTARTASPACQLHSRWPAGLTRHPVLP